MISWCNTTIKFEINPFSNFQTFLLKIILWFTLIFCLTTSIKSQQFPSTFPSLCHNKTVFSTLQSKPLHNWRAEWWEKTVQNNVLVLWQGENDICFTLIDLMPTLSCYFLSHLWRDEWDEFVFFFLRVFISHPQWPSVFLWYNGELKKIN